MTDPAQDDFPAPPASPLAAFVGELAGRAQAGGLRVLLASGKQQIVEYTVPASGELALLCHLPGHIERGMVGAIELRTTIGPGGSGRPATSPAGAGAG